MARKSIRRSQAVVPFGIGAIVDFPNQALMAAGLDAWPPEPKCEIYDARLARRLGVAYFREPPPAPRPGAQSGGYLPFVRFPLWHFCPRCRALKQAAWNEIQPPRCASDIKPRTGAKPCATLPERRRWRMVPVRFVVVCENGHIDDFPWVGWAHSPKAKFDSKATCAAPKLRLNYTGKAGLMGLIVKCESCNAPARSLMGSAGKQGLPGLKCSGNRPWLGPNGIEPECPKPPVCVPRGATNLHFSKVASSILIPPHTTPIRKLLDDPVNWTALTSGVNAGGQLDETRIRMFAELRRLDLAELRSAVHEKMHGVADDGASSEDDFRHAEYQALLSGKCKPEDDLVLKPQDLAHYGAEVGNYFGNVILVEKLAETRALTGFARLSPPAMREFDRDDQRNLSLRPVDWLPATRVYGEGIFLTVSYDRLADWERRAVGRVSHIQQNHLKACQELKRKPRTITPAFILLHTLAHLLIRRLSFECGYGSSSVRERIYCRREGDRPMAGLLLYTAAGDCEGTLGGLVRQGKPGRLEAIMRGALQDARWCGSDPLCSETRGQGTDSVNLAACHACALLPETSCEEGNRFLDRILLVGQPEQPALGFFNELVEELYASA